jgi:hypothetical protein
MCSALDAAELDNTSVEEAAYFDQLVASKVSMFLCPNSNIRQVWKSNIFPRTSRSLSCSLLPCTHFVNETIPNRTYSAADGTFQVNLCIKVRSSATGTTSQWPIKGYGSWIPKKWRIFLFKAPSAILSAREKYFWRAPVANIGC